MVNLVYLVIVFTWLSIIVLRTISCKMKINFIAIKICKDKEQDKQKRSNQLISQFKNEIYSNSCSNNKLDYYLSTIEND